MSGMMGMHLGGLKVVRLMGPIDAIDGVDTDPPERRLSEPGVIRQTPP
jgi:hypothetical protein